jgi:hypothetical protein
MHVVELMGDGVRGDNGRPKSFSLKVKMSSVGKINYQDVVRRGILPDMVAFITAFFHSGRAAGDKLTPSVTRSLSPDNKRPITPIAFPFHL